jgi:integrase
VNLDAGHIQVRSSVRKTKEGFHFSEPKTAQSRRRVALTLTATEALHRHHARQDTPRAVAGSSWRDEDLVFSDALGAPFDGITLLRREFVPLLKRAGLPIIRFHDLRHTAATLLLSRGINPKVVSEMLGHSNSSITLSLYGHVTPHVQQQAADMMDRLLGGFRAWACSQHRGASALLAKPA